MKLFIFILFYFYNFNLDARVDFIAKIHHIDQGWGDEETLIFLSNGKVAKLAKRNNHLLTILQTGYDSKVYLKITLNKNHLVNVKKYKPSNPKTSSHNYENYSHQYVPTILNNLEEAKNYFNLSRTDARKDSQCFNRAHIWAYEWRTRYNIYSSKVWIFFSQKYIRRHNFDWWFHIAPMTYIYDHKQMKEKVMDIKYTKEPTDINVWKNIFIKDNSQCFFIDQYSDYADYPESASCYIMKSSMYYYQPSDLEDFEITGKPKTRWVKREIQEAYNDTLTNYQLETK